MRLSGAQCDFHAYYIIHSKLEQSRPIDIYIFLNKKQIGLKWHTTLIYFQQAKKKYISYHHVQNTRLNLQNNIYKINY